MSFHGVERIMVKVYLAGFDVFRPDAIAYGEFLKMLCREVGMEGLFPLDNQIPGGLSEFDAAAWIYQQNIQTIRNADAVIANVEAFRGYEPDSGTCFEFGFAAALNKPVFAYCPEWQPMIDQVPSGSQPGTCPDGYAIENFGLPKNLMLACSWKGQYRTADAAITAASMYFHS